MVQLKTVVVQKGGNVPEYLNVEYFQRALESGLSIAADAFEIRSVKISSGSGGGENYCSDIFRTLIEYASGDEFSVLTQISLIVKSVRVDFVEKLTNKPKETQMYAEVLPALEKLSDVTFGPKLYYATTDEEYITYVFEDLVASGFELKDRTVGLDEDHARVLLQKLGQLHAASMVLVEEQPTAFDNFNEYFFQDTYAESNPLYKLTYGNLAYLASLAAQWEGYETIAEKLKALKPHLAEKILRFTKDSPTRVRVLNHGDLWVNNFLFSYEKEGGKPNGATLIDWQISVYGSPGVDVHHFLISSVQLDVLRTKREELLRAYYESFKSSLEKLQFEHIPTWDDISREIHESEMYEFWLMEAIVPVLILNKEDSSENSVAMLDNAEAERAKREAMFKSKRIQELFMYSLKRFDEAGVLDLDA